MRIRTEPPMTTSSVTKPEVMATGAGAETALPASDASQSGDRPCRSVPPFHPIGSDSSMPAASNTAALSSNLASSWASEILDAVNDSISVHDQRFRIVFQNRPHRETVGDLTGTTCYESLRRRQEPCDECPMQSMFRDGRTHTVNRTICIDGMTRHFEVTVSPLRDPKGKLVAGVEISRDTTERRNHEERLRFMSSHDAMTGLHNRLHFEEEVLRLSAADQCPIGIIMADVDDLKSVNDAHGHAAGDRLLQEAAGLLRQAFRSTDVIARIGGDEFAIILPGTDEQATHEAVDRLRRLSETFAGDGGPRLSIGFSTARCSEEIGATLLAADHSMYRDKMLRTGRAPRQRYHYGTTHIPEENFSVTKID